jgi:CBS domain-containing protein
MKEAAMRVGQILRTKRPDVVVISPDATVRSAVALMKRERVGALVIVDSVRHLLGVISERDIVHSLADEGAALLQTPVRNVMQTNGPVATVDDTVQSVMHAMTVSRARHVPIVEGDQMIGIVSIGDVVKSRLDEKMQENDVLQDLARLHLLAS